MDFAALLRKARIRQNQINASFVRIQWISGNRLFNLLQSPAWSSLQRNQSGGKSACFLIAVQDEKTFEKGHIRGATRWTNTGEDTGVLSQLKSTYEELDSSVSCIVYGSGNNEASFPDSDFEKCLKRLSGYVYYVESLFALKESAETLQKNYPVIFISNNSSLEEKNTAWLKYPFELVFQQLYCILQDVLKTIASPAIRALQFDFLVELSTNPCIKDCESIHMRFDLPRYIYFSPSPSSTNGAKNMSINYPILTQAVSAICERLVLPFTKVCVFSQDDPCITMTVLAAALIRWKKWTTDTSIAFLTSKQLPIRWTSDQMLLLRKFEAENVTQTQTTRVKD